MIDYIIGISVAVIVLLIVVRGIRKKLRGEASSCGCSCNKCPSSSNCHIDE